MRIARPVFEEIGGELARAYPDEGCGFLVGDRSGGTVVVRRSLPVENRRSADGRSRTRYLITPDDFRVAERDADAHGMLVVGTYHSHPDVEARPSAYDRDHAWPWYRYLIVSVVAGTVRGARVWELRDDRSGFDEHRLCMEEH
jgi:proteasome lid subunit RPN8/RPN11